ncbi:hypothetical protein BDW59DRAFT_47649 [Aspergillus cavernicola]|uniref:Uncharacterized protein n=1 Tax=Aspergillus cavernicola TaxID=176166 RepID=A0ABR4J329_9EURO
MGWITVITCAQLSASRYVFIIFTIFTYSNIVLGCAGASRSTSTYDEGIVFSTRLNLSV